MRKDFSADAISLKERLFASKKAFEESSVDLLTGQEFVERELQWDWYRRCDELVKKLDEVTSGPMVLEDHQRMWVGHESHVEETNRDLSEQL